MTDTHHFEDDRPRANPNLGVVIDEVHVWNDVDKENRVAALMGALERSVADAKVARRQYRADRFERAVPPPKETR